MNIKFMVCLVLAILFLVIGIIFSLLKEEGAKYVSGFSTLNHPENYDKHLFLWICEINVLHMH